MKFGQLADSPKFKGDYATFAAHLENREDFQRNADILTSAFEKMFSLGGNPWVFSADARHFWQFANFNDRKVLTEFTDQEHECILGSWDEEDWKVVH